jgi:membrane protease YdiL (CAAX protease family)
MPPAIVPPSTLGAIGRLLAFIVLFLGLAIVAEVFLAPALTWLVGRTGQRLRIDQFTGLAAAIGATAIMVRAVDVRPWSDLGLGRSAVPGIGVGLLIGALTIGAACALLLAIGWLRIAPTHPGSWLGAMARISFFLAPAALSEELLSRGYLFTVIRDKLGAWGAVALTSVAFGLLHLFNPGATMQSVAIVTLAGIFLAAVRVAYESLYAAWGAHLAWNWVLAVPLHAPVSGLRLESPDYRTVSAGPEWITGGAWGPEGGAVAALAVITGLAYLYARRRREES